MWIIAHYKEVVGIGYEDILDRHFTTTITPSEHPKLVYKHYYTTTTLVCVCVFMCLKHVEMLLFNAHFRCNPDGFTLHMLNISVCRAC